MAATSARKPERSTLKVAFPSQGRSKNPRLIFKRTAESIARSTAVSSAKCALVTASGLGLHASRSIPMTMPLLGPNITQQAKSCAEDPICGSAGLSSSQ
jgi:hypothetical protein